MAIKISGTTVIDDSRKLTNMRYTTTVLTANANLTAGEVAVANVATLVLTLPGSPTVGDQIKVIESAGATDTVVNRNGNPIQGQTANLLINTAYSTVDLIYTDATTGWVLGS